MSFKFFFFPRLLILIRTCCYFQGRDLSNLFKNKPQIYFFPPAVLPEEVQFLWRQAATVAPLSGLDLQVGERGPESTDSEKEREREMVEMAEMAEREERHELSPKEVGKGVWFGNICGDILYQGKTGNVTR